MADPERTQFTQDILRREVQKVVADFLRGQGFTSRKLTDMPTDNLQMVNRKYVTMNGVVANRPPSSVATVGQFYLATDTNIPMWYTTAGWRNGSGSIVAQNS